MLIELGPSAQVKLGSWKSGPGCIYRKYSPLDVEYEEFGLLFPCSMGLIRLGLCFREMHLAVNMQKKSGWRSETREEAMVKGDV